MMSRTTRQTITDLDTFIELVDAAEENPTEATIAAAKSYRQAASCGSKSFYAADEKLGQVIFDFEQDQIEADHNDGQHKGQPVEGCYFCPDDDGDPYQGYEPPELEDYRMGLL